MKTQKAITPIKFSSLDPDALAFILAAGITDSTQKSAINTLVLGLKSDNLWTKMKAVYPFVGGTATNHKYNLKDPRDLDAAFRLTFSGGWTHSVNGALPNGANAYADTFFIPSANLTTTSGHLSFYSRSSQTSFSYEMGANNSNDYRQIIIVRFVDGNQYARYGDTFLTAANSNGEGHYITNRNSSTNTTGYKNGNQVINGADSGNLSTQSIFLGALNNSGTASLFSDKQCAFATIGDGLTNTDASNLYTLVQSFQTSLSRQV